jgi:hypothetical protein
MVTLQTLLQTTYDNQYHQNSYATWRELLFPTDFPVKYTAGTYTSYLYSITDMQTFLQSIIRRYDSLEERSIDIMSTYATLSAVVGSVMMLDAKPARLVSNRYGSTFREQFQAPEPLKPPTLKLELMDIEPDKTLYGLPFSRTTITTVYTLSADNPLGPFKQNGTELRALVDRLMQAELELHIYAADITRHIPLLFMWTVKAHFDFRSRGGRVKATMSSRSKIERFNDADGSLMEFLMLATTWPDVVVIILGTVFCFQSAKMLLSETRMHIDSLAPEEMHVVQNWHWFLDVVSWDHVVNVMSGLFNVCFSIFDLSMTDYGGDLQFGRILLGVSVFLSFVSLTFHLRWFPSYYILASALNRSIAPVARLLLGILPIFMGFVFIMMVWFGMYCDQFSTLHETIITLFCVLNGDVMQSTFNDVNVEDPLRGLLSTFVLFAFCVLFMYVVLSIFVVILEDAYFMVRCDVAGEVASPRRGGAGAFLPPEAQELISQEERAMRQRESLRLRPARNYENYGSTTWEQARGATSSSGHAPSESAPLQ